MANGVGVKCKVWC